MPLLFISRVFNNSDSPSLLNTVFGRHLSFGISAKNKPVQMTAQPCFVGVPNSQLDHKSTYNFNVQIATPHKKKGFTCIKHNKE